MRIRSLAYAAALLLALSAAPATASGPGAAEAVLFGPGTISSPDQEEYRLTFTPDGRTMYFTRAASFFPVSRQATIYQSRRTTSGTWSTPVVAPFSGKYSDIDPYVTPDGKRLYFSSIRPVNGEARDDIDVWYVERRGNGWSEPRHAGPVNLPGTNAVGEPVDELYPSIGPDGALYVGSNRDGGLGGWDVWKAAPRRDGTFGPAVNVGPSINTAGWEFNPVVSPDGRHLLFARIAEFAPPWGELQASARTRSGWAPPRPVAAVNTGADEYHPAFSPDGRQLYFVRNAVTETSNGDFYTIPTRHLRLGR